MDGAEDASASLNGSGASPPPPPPPQLPAGGGGTSGAAAAAAGGGGGGLGDAASAGGESGGEEYQLEDEEYEPTEQEIAEYCEWLGMDAESEAALMWIAREALKAPLPEYWKICYTEEREVYYFNMRTGESIWDHPMDAYYKSLFKQEQSKLDKKRKKMRLFSGSMPIVALQELFSEQAAEGELSGASGTALEIPEPLCDPIDFTLLIDPVVLPTSGRTVSKHTIINNKWRDPFTREYVENRRLIHNVDKRREVDDWLAGAVKGYFADVSFPPAVTQWAADQGHAWVFEVGAAAAGSGAAPDTSACLPPAETFPRLLKLLPYILDKEEQVALEAQRLVLRYLVTGVALAKAAAAAAAAATATALAAAEEAPGSPTAACMRRGKGVLGDVRALRASGPATSPAKATTTAAAAAVAAAPAAGSVKDVVAGLTESGALLRPLLTMSTSASLEALALVLTHVPALREHECFASFSQGTLGVLQLAQADLHDMSNAVAAGCAETFPPQESTSELHVLAKLSWEQAVLSIAAAQNSLPSSPQMTETSIKMLRGLAGWPAKTKQCSAEAVQWMVNLAVSSASPLQQILLLYDLLANNGDAAAPVCRAHKGAVVRQLVAVARDARNARKGSGGGSRRSSAAAAAAAATPLLRPVDMRHCGMLAALLVAHEVCRLDEFSDDATLLLHASCSLLPRLTRVRWRPRHFEATASTVAAALSASPEEGWAVAKGSERVDFVLKELAKKRRSSDELRMQLDAIEATEKRLQQSCAINNWLVLASRLSGEPTPAGRASLRREDLVAQRMANFVSLLKLLVAVRMKPKGRAGGGGVGAAGLGAGSGVPAGSGGGGGGVVGLPDGHMKRKGSAGVVAARSGSGAGAGGGRLSISHNATAAAAQQQQQQQQPPPPPHPQSTVTLPPI